MPYGLKNGQITEVDDEEIDVELASPSSFFGGNVNHIPMQSAVQVPRLFYGARFFNQAVPLKNPQSAIVRNADDDGTSFDEISGRKSGAVFADEDAEILDVTPDSIRYRTASGEEKEKELYNNFKYNRKTSISNTPLVAKGQKVAKGTLLAKSNYTDGEGTLALGRNALVALVPYKGYSMDDAVVVSSSFAKDMRSVHDYGYRQEYDTDIKGGKDHYVSLFPTEYKKNLLDRMDGDGVVLPGTRVSQGDPLVLATKPKAITSGTATLGRLSKAMAQSRTSAAQEWDHEEDGVVTDVARTRNGVKVVVKSESDLKVGDKIVLRSGQKGIVSKILEDRMAPRLKDGRRVDVLLNPLGIPSRANSELVYELLMGKVAEASGQVQKLKSFTTPGESWHDVVKAKMAEAGLAEEEELFDPESGEFLENPVGAGVGHVMKLQHMVDHKSGSRGQGSYDANEQPMRGGSDSAQAKRLSGLEVSAMLSSSAYHNLREAATLRGQKCFDDKTEVLTRRGWLPWNAVTLEDELYTQDGRDNAYFEKPDALHSYHYKGEMYGFEGRYIDWLVTPDHRIWLQHIKSNKRCFKTAEELFGRTFYIPQFGSVYAGTLKPSHKIELPNLWGYRSYAVSVSIYDYCDFMGWWLSEGSANVDSQGRGRVVISQVEDSSPDNVAYLRRLIGRMGLTCMDVLASGSNYARKGSVVGLRIHSRALAEHVKQFGGRAHNKFIPQAIFEAPLDARLKFLESFIKGDGHINKKNKYKKGPSRRASSTSRRLVDDLQRLAIMSGDGGTISKINHHETHNILHQGWYIGFAANRRNATVDGWNPSPKFKHHYKEAYDGMVYCATLPSGVLYVRRNGKAMWSGNCDSYWRALREGHTTRAPGKPFVWDKFQALLMGSGMFARNLGDGRLRLGPMTDRELDSRKPLEVLNGDMVDSRTLRPVKGGLFDEAATGANKWGYVRLPRPVPNPAFEDQIAHLLGITRKKLRAVLAGDEDL
jgi:hypothetical protein